jgi:VCBS repeat protein/FG-GAP repeat protein
MSLTRLGVSTFVLAFGALAPAVRSQTVLFEYDGSKVGDIQSGASIGDWSGDGIGDFAVGVPLDDSKNPDAGAVYLISGSDGSILSVWYGTNKADYFGSPVAIPDVDGDGKPEVLVCDPTADVGGSVDIGAVYLYSSATSTALWKKKGTNGLLGAIAGPTRDLDGDGAPDVFVAEKLAVRLFSGKSGTLLFTLPAPAGDPTMNGFATCDLGDVNGDGVDDFMVTSPLDDTANTDAGAAKIFSGADQSVLSTLFGTNFNEQFGYSCARLGDADGDGIRDFAVVSLYQDYQNGRLSPVIHVFSAATNALIADIKTPNAGKYDFQPLVWSVGDSNGDGVEDFILNELWPGTNGVPSLYSGRTLMRLYGFDQSDDGGFIPFSAGDFDGDGFTDLLGNAPSPAPGHIDVFSGSELWLDVKLHAPTTGSLLELTTREGPAGSLTVLAIVGADGVPTFQIVGGLGSFDGTGTRYLSGNVPAGLSGHTVDFMAFADLGHVAATAVESVTFQ